MPYPTREELVAASNVAELTELSAAQQDAYRAVAIANVERYSGQSFLPTIGDLVVDGSGGSELYLARRVEELTGIVVKGTSIDLTDVLLSDKGDRLHFVALSDSYAVQAMRETSYDTRTFRTGAGTVILTGTFGWTVVPDAVEQAIRVEMEDLARADASRLSGIAASARRLGIRDVSQGNLRLSLVGQPGEVSAAAARLLEPYVWLPAAGSLV